MSYQAPVLYAGVGGFNPNTPTTPGHVFQVTCTTDCASFTWADKTGNLPDVPVDSIIANPKFPQQVFAGTDFGLYFTNNINAASPNWSRFENGLPHSMVWDMQIDRGATTLSVWTRSRGAYVWPLPSGPVAIPTPTNVVSRKTHGGAGTFDINLLAPANATECRSGGATGDHTVVVTFPTTVSVLGNGSVEAQVSSGVGQVGSGGVANGNAVSVSGNTVTIPLTNVANAQRLSITLYTVSDGTNSGNVIIPINTLLGDTTNNGSVTASDVGQTKAVSGVAVDAGTFRNDVNANGAITASDLGIVKAQTGTSLP